MKILTNKLKFFVAFMRSGSNYSIWIIYAFFDRFIGHHKIIRWKDGKPIFTSMAPPLFSDASAKLFGNALFDGFFQKNTLYEVNIALGDICNASCPHCSFYESIYSAEKTVFTKEQYIHTINEIQSLGATNIVFVWGEPLMYDGVEEVIASVDKKQSITTLFTNGYFLEEKAKALSIAWLNTIAISIDHYNLKVHDFKRGIQWLSSKIKLGIQEAKKYDFTMVMSVCLFEWDYKELPKYMDLAKELGFHEVIIFPAFPSWRLHWKVTKPVQESFWKLKEIIDGYNNNDTFPWIYWYSWISSSYSLGCQGGKKYIYISPYGDILHCDFKNHSYWNIVETPLKIIMQNIEKLWYSNICSAFDK